MITCWRLLGLIEVIEGFSRDRPGWYSTHGKCSDVWVIFVFFAEICSRSVWSDGEADEVWLYAFFGGRPNLPKCFAFLTNQLNFELTVLPLCVPSANPTNVAIRSQLPSDIDRRVIHCDCSGGQIGWGRHGQRSFRSPNIKQPSLSG